MHIIRGGCHCGKIQLSAELSETPESYNPRACDCDFCRKHGAAYISDPSGHLRISLKPGSDDHRYRQGSGTAEFLLCPNCGVLVAVLYNTAASIYAAVNTRCMDDSTAFGKTNTTSPQTLSSSEKTKRWQDIWFSNVDVMHEE